MYKHKHLKVVIVNALLAALVFNTTQWTVALSKEKTPQEFPDFANLRTEILAKIGSASKRVWLTTDFLTDADIVSSLFIARYRKIEISVLLGRDRATNVLSRLNYLKQVNIPVSLRPRGFYSKHPTILLIDNQIYGISRNLDHTARNSRSVIQSLSDIELKNFESQFLEAAKLQNAPEMAPLPRVGRARPNARYYKASESTTNGPGGMRQTGTVAPQTQEKSPFAGRARMNNDTPIQNPNQGPSYRYRAARDRAPEGVPTRLPRTPLHQELQRERERVLRNNQGQDRPAE